MTALLVLSALALAAWICLALFHHRFWRADQRLAADTEPRPDGWPAVAGVVPARNEADVVAAAVTSLLDQDYPGPLKVILVDDHSTDGTATAAIEAGRASDRPEALRVVASEPLPAGWAGKLWAVSQGIAEAGRTAPDARYLWLTDADVAHDPGQLRRLVAKAEADGLDLVSLMVMLWCRSAWERLLIPAFVFFFQKLYPFPAVSDRASSVAGAAGGCMLVRRTALEAAGGIEAIRGALIDDCALGRLVKARLASGGGGVWLGLTTRARSLRPYQGLADIWRMVARSAFDQLHYSHVLLAGTLAGMVLLYLLPPAAALGYPLHGDAWAALFGLAAWLLMAGLYAPTLRLYGMGWLRGLLLPAAGVLYAAMTLDSALRHWRGAGGAWKGRVHSAARQARAQRSPRRARG
jgi:hopene-associated glycosyltransferase HpnB